MFTTTLISNIVVGVLLGYYIDKWTFKNGVLLFIFTILGIFSGLYNGFKILLKESERYDKSEKVNKKDDNGDNNNGSN
nr:AtpZ/AtpI family protein [Thermotoga sp. KOL6]